MQPEEKLARRFLESRNLVPPIDIRSVVLELADIEERQIPGTADAILLAKSGKRRKPLVILQSSASPARQIFTLAHELGHIVIPWHVGTFVCHTDLHIRVSDYIYGLTEIEANRFAAEALMPSTWVQSLVEQRLSITKIIHTLQTTNASILVATFALQRSLPAGFIFAEVTHSGEIVLSGKSKGTYIDAPVRGTQLADATIHALVSTPETMTTPSGKIYWWHLKRITRSAVIADLRDSKEILRTIINDVSSDVSRRTKLMQMVNGVVGAANGKARSIDVDIYTVLRGRFLERPQLNAVIQHPLFESFLVRKTEELELR